MRVSALLTLSLCLISWTTLVAQEADAFTHTVTYYSSSSCAKGGLFMLNTQQIEPQQILSQDVEVFTESPTGLTQVGVI